MEEFTTHVMHSPVMVWSQTSVSEVEHHLYRHKCWVLNELIERATDADVLALKSLEPGSIDYERADRLERVADLLWEGIFNFDF
jgi:hypothetical protein